MVATLGYTAPQIWSLLQFKLRTFYAGGNKGGHLAPSRKVKALFTLHIRILRKRVKRHKAHQYMVRFF